MEAPSALRYEETTSPVQSVDSSQLGIMSNAVI